LRGEPEQLKRQKTQCHNTSRETEQKGRLSRADFLKIAAGMATASALSALAGWRGHQAYLSSVAEASYVIGKDGTTIFARNGKTGEIEYSGTDAAAVIDNAIKALSPGRTWKEKVSLKGNFEISDTIKIPSYTTIEIDGKLRLTGANKNLFENANVRGNSNITIRGGFLDGNRSIHTADSMAIRFQNVSYAEIIRTYFTKFFHHCIALGNPRVSRPCSYILIDDCIFDDAAGDDTVTPMADSHHITVANCVFKDQPGGGQEVGSSAFEPEDGAHDILFTNNQVYNYTYDAIFIHTHSGWSHGYSIYVIDNIIQSCGDALCTESDFDGYNLVAIANVFDYSKTTFGGVRLRGGKDISLIGGSVSNSRGHGIFVENNASRVLISGVTIKNNGQAKQAGLQTGIYVVVPSVIVKGCIVGDDQARATQLYQIYVSAGSNIIITDNYIFTKTAGTDYFKGIRVNNASDVTIEHNIIEGAGGENKWGISEENTSDNNIFKDNKFLNLPVEIAKIGANTITVE